MKIGSFILVGLVLATIVYQVMMRVPAETLSIALGVACGVAASIPVTVGLLIALLRERSTAETYVEERPAEPAPARMPYQPPQPIAPPAMPQPQIIVLSPNGQFMPGQMPQNFQMPAQWQNMANPYMHEHSNAVDAREWRIIGEE